MIPGMGSCLRLCIGRRIGLSVDPCLARARVQPELRKADDAFDGASLGQNAPVSFRKAYVQRLRLVRAEVDRLPRTTPEVERFLKVLDDDIRFFETGG